MLRLPIFGTVTPTSLKELVAALQSPGARIVAGGTDILPNLKHRLYEPEVLVSLDRVAELQQVTCDDRFMRIGAAVTLSEIAGDKEVQTWFPSLAKAAGAVASPLIRNMATLGGNLNLDTRCRYVNQSEFWRGAIGGCLKSQGDVCHVVPKGRSCVAAMSSDCVPVLISLGASVVQVGAAGTREIPLSEYYNTDGLAHTNRLPGEFSSEIVIPRPEGATLSSYTKWSVRGSIDYPLVSIAMHFALDSDGDTICDAHICLGVLAAKPKVLRTSSLLGKSVFEPETASMVGELCFKQGKPLDNVPYESAYRRKMLRVYGKRAVLQLAQQHTIVP